MKLVYIFSVLGIAVALIAQPRCAIPQEDTNLKINSDGALSYRPYSGYRKVPRRGYCRFDCTAAMAWYDDPIVEH